MIKSITYSITFFILCGIIACDKDKGAEPTFRVIDLGMLTPLQSSIDLLPYSGKSGVVFRDSTGNQVLFELIDNGTAEVNFIVVNYNMYTPGDTVHAHFRTEQKEFQLLNDSLGMTVSITVQAVPYYSFPEPGPVADELMIRIRTPIFPILQPVFSMIVDRRTWPLSTNSNTTSPEVEIFGKTFYDVWPHFIAIPGTAGTTYFNYEFGLISFKDHAGKQWRWERWE
jgi:hypothetical protein